MGFMKRAMFVWSLTVLLMGGCRHVQKYAYSPGIGDEHLIFTSFVHGEERTLYLLYSRNGYAWRNLGPFLTSPFPMRDPMIAQGPDGSFHAVWTTGATHAIGYASSDDLIEWPTPRQLPVMEPIKGSRNCWAPELFFDEAEGHWLIVWSSSVRGRFKGTRGGGERDGVPWNHRLFACTTTDFETFGKPMLLFDPGYSVIDGAMVHRGGRYYLLYKNESVATDGDDAVFHDYLEVVDGASATGPWSTPTRLATPQWVEGPAPVELGGKIVVFYDQYSRGRYGAIESRDMEHWSSRSMTLTMPKGHRHGSVLRVPGDVAARVLEEAE